MQLLTGVLRGNKITNLLYVVCELVHKGKREVIMKKRKFKVIIAFCLALTLALVMCSCSSSDGESEVAMNTVQSYQPTEEEDNLIRLVASCDEASDAIVQFAVDETYKNVHFGYDLYKDGKLVEENCGEAEVPLSDEDGAQTFEGKIDAFIDDNGVVINMLSKGETSDSYDNTSLHSPIDSDKVAFSDEDFLVVMTMDNPAEIKDGEKIYISVFAGDNGDEVDAVDVSTFMKDDKLLAGYDKCCAFYVLFDKKAEN